MEVATEEQTKIILEYPVKYKEYSEHIGALRTAFSKDIYSPGTGRYRGDDEPDISWLGVMGELITNFYLNQLKEQGKVRLIQPAPILAYEPWRDADVTYYHTSFYRGANYRVDAKCTSNGFFNVNCNAHANNVGAKRIDQYFFIKLTKDARKLPEDNKAYLEIVPHNDVNSWEEKEGKDGSRYYSRAVHVGQ